MKYYTGIGSRNTPDIILSLMTRIAVKLANMDFILRSGGAIGADSAFELGSNNSSIQIFNAIDATPAACELASKFHPAWDRCSVYAKKLHGRNTFQILGRNLLTPSQFVVCWTSDQAITHKERSIKTGGTGTAISIANHNHIPVFNLARPDHFKRLSSFAQGGAA